MHACYSIDMKQEHTQRFGITIYVDGDQYDQLTKLSLTRKASKSEVVRQMIADYFDKAVKKGIL